MKRIHFAALALLLLFASTSVLAQAGYANLIASKIGGEPHPLASGKLCYLAVDNNNRPLLAAAAYDGQTLAAPVCATVTAGVLAAGFEVPDTSVTTPVNMCLRVTVTDSNQNGKVVYAAPCVQPAQTSAQSSWCATGLYGLVCNFDSYKPSLPAQALVQIGPIGLTGAQGASTITGMSGDGAGNATLTHKFTAETVAAGATVSPFAQSVICTNGNNSADYLAVQGAADYIRDNASGGNGTLRIPENAVCNILPPSSTATEALLIASGISLENHGTLNFQMPAPLTASATACSTANTGSGQAAISTATITATNSFVPGWTGTIPVTGTSGAFSGGCTVLNGKRFTVLSSGLSSAQFKYIVPQDIATPISTLPDTATVSASMSAVRFLPASPVNNVKWENGTFNMVTAPNTKAASGGDMFNFDCSAGGNFDLFRMDNFWVGPSTLGFNSLFMDNNTSISGCMFQSHFKDLIVVSGAYFQNVGDDNTWDGAGEYVNGGGDGFNARATPYGSLNNTLAGATFEGTGSAIHLRGGPNWLINHVESANDVAGVNATANIWLDSAGYIGYSALNGTIIENSAIGIDTPTVSNGAPVVQIDNLVTNTTLRNNIYNPQVLSGVPQCGVLHNGAILNIESSQLTTPFNSYPLFCGSGSYGPNPPLTAAGGGKPLENDGIWSENPTNWATAVSGAGSSVTVAGTPTAVTLPNGQPGSAYAVTLTLGSQSSSSYLAWLIYNSTATLPDPHGAVYKVMVMPTACPTPTSYTIRDTSEQTNFNCNGPYNGWTQLKSIYGSTTGTSAQMTIRLTGDQGLSTTASFYVTWGQISQHDGEYVKTTSQPVPLSYGTNPTNFAGPYPVIGPNGWQDTSTAARPSCSVLNRGLEYTEKGTGPNGSDLVLECTATSAGGATYGWQTLYQVPQPTENYLLQSNTWNVSPWVFGNGGVGSIPVVTAAAGVTDPFGNIGTVQEVAMNLNGGVTSSDTSAVYQIVSASKPNPHASTVTVWLRMNTGTATVYFRNLYGASHIVNLTTAWTAFTWVDSAVANTNDWWYLALIGNITSQSADIYTSGAGLTYNGGSVVVGGAPTITTTAAIDNTANAPVVAAPGTSGKILIGQGGGAYAPKTMSGSCTITAAGVITCPTLAAVTPVPGWLQYLGTGTEGANITASGTMSGAHYYTNFTVPFGNTVTVNSSTGLVIHATGTCTIAGTIAANGTVSGGSQFDAASGGGGGGGTAAGTAGSAGFLFYASVAGVTGAGTAGALSGGAGGNGTAATAAFQQMILNGGTTGGLGLGGSNGGAGGSAGPAGGFGGQGVTLICGSITGTDGTHTGSINANGANGGASTGNSIGSSGGGAGGVVILSSQAAVGTWPTITTLAGSGGSCGAFTTCGAGGNGGAGWSAEFQGW